MERLAVIGAGYVGLVTGVGLAELGHDVACIELDPERLSALRQGESPIHEPGLAKLLERNCAMGRLLFTGDYAEGLRDRAIVFLAVPTPSAPNGEADTSFIFAAVRALLPFARPRTVIVTKSTVPAGTGDAIAAYVERHGGRGVSVASNPEFLREGSAVQDFMHPDRIVLGAEDPVVHQRLATLYDELNTRIFSCGRRSAELAKYTANAFLATRISFMNEIAGMCDHIGADVTEIAAIVGSDRRIGPAFLQAGIGWGGSCFLKDVRALSMMARAAGCATPILDGTVAVNARQRQRASETLRLAVGSREGATVGVLGLAFKPDTDDVRESPALDIIGRLLEEGIQVRVHDPAAMANARKHLPQLTYCDSALEAARGCDALFLATEWPEYLALDWHHIGAVMRGRVVLDGRNVLDPVTLMAAGLSQIAIGRGSRSGAERRLALAGF